MKDQRGSSSSSVGSIVAGSVIGFLSGVVVGLLFAPQSGEDTRERISDYIAQGKEKGEELLSRGKEKLQSAKESMMSEGGKEPFYESNKYT